MSRNYGDQVPENLLSINDEAIDMQPVPMGLLTNSLDHYNSQFPVPMSTISQTTHCHLPHQGTWTTELTSNSVDAYADGVAYMECATQSTTPLDIQTDWRQYPPNSLTMGAHGFPVQMSSDHRTNFQYLSSRSFADSDGLIAAIPRDTVAQDLPLLTHAISSASQPAASVRNASSSKVARRSNPPHLHQQKRSKVEKARRPAPKGKKTSKLSSIKSLMTPQSKPSSGQGQQNPDSVTIAVCHLWLVKNPGIVPSEHTMSCLSFLFGDSPEAIRDWFSRNVTTIQDDDSGYQTMTTLATDVASSYRHNRRECNRKAHNSHRAVASELHFDRDDDRPYACTSRCGAMFQEKSAWKRHEEINRPPKLWLCRFQACQTMVERKRVYFRMDHFRKHLSNNHSNLNPTASEIATCCITIDSNFCKHCIFRDCNEQFKEWNERINHIAAHLEKPWDMSQWRDLDSEAEDTESANGRNLGFDSSDEEDDPDDTGDDDDNGPGLPENGHGSGAGPDDARPEFSRRQQGQTSQGMHGGGMTSYQRGFLTSLATEKPSEDQSSGSSNESLANSASIVSSMCSSLFSNGSLEKCASEASSMYSSVSSNESFSKPAGNASSSARASSVVIVKSHYILPTSVVPLSTKVDSSGLVEPRLKPEIIEANPQSPGRTLARKKICLSSSRKMQKDPRRMLEVLARLRHLYTIRVILGYNYANSPPLLIQLATDWYIWYYQDCDIWYYLNGCSSAVSYREGLRNWFSCLASTFQYVRNSKVKHRNNRSILLANDTTVPCSASGSWNLRADERAILSNLSDFTEQYAAPETCETGRERAVDVFALRHIVSELLTLLALLAPADPWRMQQWEHRRATFLTPQRLPWAIEWTSKLRQQVAHSSAAAPLLVVLDACEAMMRKHQKIQHATIDTAMKCRRLSYSAMDREGNPKKKTKKAKAVVVDYAGDTSSDESEASNVLPTLVNGSDDGTLSDISSLSATSMEKQVISKGYDPKLPKALLSKKAGKPLKKPRANAYSLPSISEESTMKQSGSYMLEGFLVDYDPFQAFLVTGRSMHRGDL